MWGDHLLGFANLCVRLSKLEPDGLRQVGVEPHALLQEKQGVRHSGVPNHNISVRREIERGRKVGTGASTKAQ